MREKKSENLEVRLPHRLKQAFMDRCRAEGRSASEAVRQLIDAHLARPAMPSKPEPYLMFKPRIAALAVLGAGLAAALVAVSAPQAGPDLREAFQALDADRNGAVTLAEFSSGRADSVIFIRRPGKAEDHGPRFTLPLTKSPELGGAVAGAKRVPLPAARIYANIDVDRSGSIDFAEYERHHRRVKAQSFASLDADKNGRVTGDEFWRPIGPGAELPGLKESLRQTFVRLDADKDGAISRAEFDQF